MKLHKEIMDIFCEKHTSCESPISVIAEILSKNFNAKYEIVLEEFKKLGFEKIKDLAKATLSKASSIPLDGDPLAKLYKAIQIYDEHCAKQLKTVTMEYKEHHFTRTKELCKEMLIHQPTNVDYLNLLGLAHFKCNEYDEAFTYLKEASTHNSNCAEVYSNIGSIFLKKKQVKDALEYYYQAICQKPDFVDGWINYAKTLVLAGDKIQASRAYLMILAYKPELYKVRNHYGCLLLSLNNTEEAELQFVFAKRSAPEFPDTWINLGGLYLKIGKIDEAIDHYKKALELDGNLTIVWINFGVCYVNLGEYSKAIDAFEKAIQLTPDNVIALTHLGHAYTLNDQLTLGVRTYEKCLTMESGNAELYYNLGLVHLKLLNYKEAEKYLKMCIELNPLKEDAFKYLGSVYYKQGELKQASEIFILLGDMYFDKKNQEASRSLYIQALYLNPNNSEGHWKLGLTYHILGNLDLALLRYKKALDLKPNFPDAYCNLALIYETKGLTEMALQYYEMALQLEPFHLNALHNLALLKEKSGDFDDVVELYMKILNQTDADALYIHINLANIFYNEQFNLHQALYHYEKAVEIDNTLLEAYLNMGSILIELKESAKALECFNKAIQLDSQCVVAYTNIGSIYKDNEHFPEAIKSYEKALSIKPDFPDAYCNLVQCYQHICNWSSYESRKSKLKSIITKQLAKDNAPSLLPHHSLMYSFSPDIVKQIASKHAEVCINKAYKVARRQVYNHPKNLSSVSRIRVGYVSSDFGDHPTSQLMQSIPRFHNRKNVEVFCYSLSPNDNSSAWIEISNGADSFVDISNMNIVEAANQIYKDGIHILINMNGHTKGARNEIFALRPAPIQVMWLGYPSTSGAEFMDYLITDKVCSPPEYHRMYTEKLVYLNRSVFVGDHKQMFNDLKRRVKTDKVHTTHNAIENFNINNSSLTRGLPLKNTTRTVYSFKILSDLSIQCYCRQQFNLPEGVVVFCNFSQLYKIDPDTWEMWMTILKSVPGSVLWLLRFPGDAEENLRLSAKSFDVDANRIVFSDLVSKEDHIRRIQLGDIFLDTPLCNGHTTCLDALWAGLPVVAMLGETFASRVAASQLTTLGHNDLVANNAEEYIYIATKLGSNRSLLESIRDNIWSSRMESKMFDCQNYTDELETQYRNLLDRYGHSEQPSQFTNSSM
ncbi:UDP-N-acetylglucosamine--peptide N-acetylglucosaminyltransferase 110 kDa subunit-like [Adelges cooleyi]|uniref:UDP-N-acetylglucosamine--peptide N-acetylglucosaminyltransferase 110 kDa subunit-like n=1 Tax=Adelges cooleyi TaxID=133065 RepID=UPI0021805903|nr:UDP-N-acetylglucosamine--peptide N-acetylglucosaminyltransferase 110 kDa subunit-like [Adelges cooleyi]XP_050434787.1 UDP-N-acetylglucosamine--peptide N-acetylglucosaminyltransferase 110 kDa subunit-like [Adelges cooleyi]